MSGDHESRAYRARYVFPIDRPPIEGGTVTVCGRHIAAVEERSSATSTGVIELGETAILPGLVNAHTHLEFSKLEQPLGRPGMTLPEWIGEVLRWRWQRDAAEDAVQRRVEAIRSGLEESFRGGATTIGEIATTDDWPGFRSPVASGDPSPSVTIFRELLGLTVERIEAARQSAETFLNHLPESAADRFFPALSPHAPYSTHPQLVADLVELASARGVPVAMHLAESPEEIDLLSSGEGAFRDLLERLGVWRQGLSGGRRPLDYLDRLSAAPRSLVIHGNYLDDEEIAFCAGRRDRMSVVYCPRTHRYFQHSPYPLRAMLDAGVRVALGTDSRASNPNLSMLEELRTAAAKHPNVSPAEILRAGTLSGAEALGRSAEAGSLTPGKRADLLVVPLEERSSRDPWQRLFASHGEPELVLIEG